MADSVISEHCITIINHRTQNCTEELLWLFDLIVRKLERAENSTIENYSRIVQTLKTLSGTILIDPLIVNHRIFHFIQDFFIDLLIQWMGEGVNDDLFEDIIELFRTLIDHIKATGQVVSSPFQQWFLNEKFFQAIASVLNDICTNFNRYLNEHRMISSFKVLIRSIQYYQEGHDEIRDHPNVLLLVEPVINCLSSSIYFQTLRNVDLHPTPSAELLLFTIPCYCIWNRGEAQFLIIHQLCLNNILKSYEDIYDFLLPSINDWSNPLMESMFYMTALLRYVAYYPETRKYLLHLKIIDSIMIILAADCLMDNMLIATDYNAKTNVSDSAISFVFNLTNDCSYLSLIKENSFFSNSIFLKLTQAKIIRIKLHAFMVLAKILNEEDILKLDHIDASINVFFKYLSKALDHPLHSFEDVPIEHLLRSLKAFVQHDQIKEEIAKNSSFFERLIRCAMEKEYRVDLVLQVSLEIIWLLTFNGRIREILVNQYDSFLNYVKTVLSQWNEERVRVAAIGILWKLENESIFKRKILNQDTDSQSSEKYDLMISYSHSNKDLCHQIHQSLIEQKYRVWIDLENMYGSTFQSMAQGIEVSEMILVCMSTPYKQSAYCQSEAEYAYTRRRHIIPLVLEKKYRPDGWLGLICGSKLYVDFTKGEFEQAVQKLIGQIRLHQRRFSPHPLNHETVSIVEQSKNPIEPSELVLTDSGQPLQNWTHKYLLNFLREKNLDILRPLFEGEQQFDGHALLILYEQCQANMESTYRLLNSQLNQFNHQILPYTTFIRFVSELTKISNQDHVQ